VDDDRCKSDFEDLRDKVDIMGQNLADLNIQQRLSIQEWELFRISTKEFRDKLDKILTGVIDHQKTMDDRCVLRQVNCNKYDEHINREEKHGAFIKDKTFAFLLILVSSVMGVLVGKLSGGLWKQ